MLSEKIENALVQQINLEQQAAHIYLSMSAYFLTQNLPGFAHWMRKQVEEETFHALKVFDYVETRRGRIVIGELSKPKTEWNSATEVVEEAFAHEQKVSKSVDNLIDLCREERDYATENFLQWFVAEQVEEEAALDEVLQKIKQVNDSPSGMYLLDKEMGERNPAPMEHGSSL